MLKIPIASMAVFDGLNAYEMIMTASQYVFPRILFLAVSSDSVISITLFHLARSACYSLSKLDSEQSWACSNSKLQQEL
jgi:hypothetical protein